MTGNKRVIFALLGSRERLETTELAVRVETFTTACQDLVSVCLMAHIPHNPVIGGRKDIMKRHCQLNRTKT